MASFAKIKMVQGTAKSEEFLVEGEAFSNITNATAEEAILQEDTVSASKKSVKTDAILEYETHSS